MANPGPGGGFRAGPISDRKQGAMRRRRKQGTFPGKPGQFPGRGPGAVKNPNYGGGVPPRTAPTLGEMTGGYDSVLDPREWKGQLPGRPPGGDIRYPPGIIGKNIKNLNYGGDVPPSGGGGAGGGGGQQRKPGASNKWIRNQLNNTNFSSQGAIDQPGWMFDNQGLNRQQLKVAMQGLADQGMGRKGLNYLLQNPALQQGLSGGIDAKSDMAMARALTPEHIRYAMQNNIGRGNVSEERWGDAQGAMFQQFPDLLQAYHGGLNHKTNPQEQARYEQLVNHYNTIGKPMPQGTIDGFMSRGINASGIEGLDPYMYTAFRNQMYGGVAPNENWSNWATSVGLDPQAMFAREQQLAAMRKAGGPASSQIPQAAQGPQTGGGGGVPGSYGMARGTTQPASSMTDLLSGYFGNQTPGLWDQNSMMPRRRF